MAALLATELIVAAAVVVAPVRETPPDATPSAPLVVGDHRSVDLINLGGPAAETLLARVAANIGAAVAAVEMFWGTDWPHRITVTATGSDRQFVALASGDLGGDGAAQWADVAAAAVADHVDPEHRMVTGQQVVFAPGAAEMSTSALRIVLTHELFHYAARIDTAADAPRWLTEGVADFVARTAPPGGPPAPPVELPSDAELDAVGPERDRAYDRAWWFTRFVAESYGVGTLRQLYLAACEPGHGDVATAVYRVLGSALPDVLADWQRWQTKD